MRCLVLIAVILATAVAGNATTWVVDPYGGGDFRRIQPALDHAEDGDTVELVDHTYHGDDNRDLDFRGKAIVLRSQSGDPSLCRINCEGSASYDRRGFYFHSGEGPGSVVEAITVLNGYMDHYAAPLHSGGAVRCYHSSPTFVRCMFISNYARFGGHIYCNESSPTLIECTMYAGSSEYDGGAIRVWFDSHPTLYNCIVSFSLNNGSVACDDDCTVTLYCCDVYGNVGGDYIECIEDQYGVNGNISRDPLFCDPEDRDFTLHENSPCAPFRPPNEECDLIGALPVGCEPTAIKMATWGAIKALFRSGVR